MALATGEINGTGLERVIYGKPAAEAIAEEAAGRDARRVFLLVSQHLDSKTDEIATIRAALGDRWAASHHGIRPHVPQSDIVTAAAKARAVDADLIVTIGGGSVTDAGKILPICLQHDVTDVDRLYSLRIQYDEQGRVQPPLFDPPAVRTIAVPTTLSGGEFNPLAGATQDGGHKKHGYKHRLLAPVTVVLDPRLARHTPEWLWLSTGVRAVDHAVETLVSTHSNSYYAGIAESALGLLAQGLTRVKAEPEDWQARLDCQFGVWQSMVPMIGGVPMGASHAIGHILGAVCHVPHGYTSCVMAPFVQDWNATVAREGQARISRAFGQPDRPAAAVLDDFIAGLGLPRRLRDVGVEERHLPIIAENTLHDIWGKTNPRPLTSAQDVMRILQAAM
ncbi:MAG: iron-containing alcohol dehydrogenase [Sphingomonadales bacterium]